jgi:soluble lytic murein transglycosylase-like protein
MRRLFAVLIVALLASLAGWAAVRPADVPPLVTKAFTPEEVTNEMSRTANIKTVEAVFRHNGCGTKFADLVARVAVEEGLNPRVLAGLIFVESSCNPAAVSECGAIGLTQVEPKVWHQSRHSLFDPEHNVRTGAHILATMIHQHGLVSGLHHYNGLGNPTQEYAMRVLHAAGIRA